MNQSIKDTAQMFMNGWITGDIEKAFKCTQLSWRQRKDPADLEIMLHRLSPEIQLGFYVVDENQFRADVRIKTMTGSDEITLQMRMIRETKPFVVSARGEWGVNPASIHEV